MNLEDAYGDADGDGLMNRDEYQAGTEPGTADTDGDGLDDYVEIMEVFTNPLNADTDSDGMPDGWEKSNGLNPLIDDAGGDEDADTLSNLEEFEANSDPWRSDTDADGLPDRCKRGAGPASARPGRRARRYH